MSILRFVSIGLQKTSKPFVHHRVLSSTNVFQLKKRLFTTEESQLLYTQQPWYGMELQILDSKSILFDCGDGTQRTFNDQRIKIGNLNHILITHLHGDHIFGLPGVIALLSGRGDENHTPLLEIYGPVGLRKFIRTALSVSKTQIPPNSLLIHEITRDKPSSEAPADGERDIFRSLPSKAWKVFETSTETVYAVEIQHKVFCLGYIVVEKDKPPVLDAEALTKAGFPPGPKYREIKAGKVTELTLENGETVPTSKFLLPGKKSRKIVYLGDTNDPSNISELAMGCDLLVHEATLEDDNAKYAEERGHSTAGMAVQFAQHIKARNLCLTHFGHARLSDMDHNQLKEEVTAMFKEPIPVYIAKDGLMFHFDNEGNIVTSEVNKTTD